MAKIFSIEIQLSPENRFQAYQGWDRECATRGEALALRREAVKAGYYAVRVVQWEGGG